MRTVVLVLLCAVGTSGCAVAGAKGPGPGPVRLDRKPDCNDGKGAVVLDGLGATVLGVASLAAFAGEEGGVGAALGLMSVGLVASAVAGSRSADRCRKAEREWEGLLMAERDDARATRPTRPSPPVVLDADGAPLGATPAVVAPPVATVKPPVATVKPPAATVKPPVTAPPGAKPPVAAAPPAAEDDADGDDDSGAEAPSDDPADWSAFWREVTR